MEDQSIELIEQALAQNDPIEALRELVIQLNKQGLGKEDIYRRFLTAHTALEENQRNHDADLLGDVMDMIAGWYRGRELYLQ